MIGSTEEKRAVRSGFLRNRRCDCPCFWMRIPEVSATAAKGTSWVAAVRDGARSSGQVGGKKTQPAIRVRQTIELGARPSHGWLRSLRHPMDSALPERLPFYFPLTALTLSALMQLRGGSPLSNRLMFSTTTLATPS